MALMVIDWHHQHHYSATNPYLKYLAEQGWGGRWARNHPIPRMLRDGICNRSGDGPLLR
jgi:hypothetical protein